MCAGVVMYCEDDVETIVTGEQKKIKNPSEANVAVHQAVDFKVAR